MHVCLFFQKLFQAFPDFKWNFHVKYDTLQVIYDIRSVPPWNTSILTTMRICMSITFHICTTNQMSTMRRTIMRTATRAIGHLESVRKMVADGRDCSEVLIQIAAVRAAITNIGKVILQDHIQHCIVDAVEHDDEQALDALCQAIDKFVK